LRVGCADGSGVFFDPTLYDSDGEDDAGIPVGRTVMGTTCTGACQRNVVSVRLYGGDDAGHIKVPRHALRL
jgi:hypothetical protein